MGGRAAVRHWSVACGAKATRAAAAPAMRKMDFFSCDKTANGHPQFWRVPIRRPFGPLGGAQVSTPVGGQPNCKKDYSSPSSSPWLDVGAPPSMDGTPAGGAAFGAPFGDAAGVLAADRGAAFFTGFLAAARLAGFFAAFRFAGFFAVLAAFFVVFVFLAPFLAFFAFLAAMSQSLRVGWLLR
jgi:hypothetical protein